MGGMSKFHTTLKFVLGHVLAGMAVMVGTVLFAAACYLILLATAPEGIENPVAGIPEFLMLMFMAGVFAVAVSTGLFLISVFLTVLRSKRSFPVWLPVLIVTLVAFAAACLALAGTGDWASIVFLTVASFVYFGTYWTILTSSAAVLDFFRRKFSRTKTGT